MEKRSPFLSPGPGHFRLFLALVVVYEHISGVMLGRAAVYLFFVLSGFWIYRMWVERYAATKGAYLTFMVSRYWRLLPTFAIASVFAAALAALTIDGWAAQFMAAQDMRSLFSHLFFVGYTGLEPRLLEPAWSLDVEMQFYLVAPLLALLLAKAGAVRFAALLVAFTGLAWLMEMPGQLKLVGWFAVGMAAAAVSWHPGKRLVAGCIALALAVLVALFTSDWQAILTDRSFYNQTTALNWVLAAILAPLAVRSCHQPSDARDRFLGDLSYPVYLIHWPLVVVAYDYLPRDGLSPLAFTMAGSILLSVIVLRWVDMPLQHLRSRWVNQRKREGEAASVAQGADKALPGAS